MASVVRQSTGRCSPTAVLCPAAVSVAPDARVLGSTADEPALTGGDVYLSDNVFGDAMYNAATQGRAKDTDAASAVRDDTVRRASLRCARVKSCLPGHMRQPSSNAGCNAWFG